MIETTAMYRPQLAADTLGVVGGIFDGLQMIVEPDKIERRPNPGDSHDEMQPACKKVQPVENICFHFSSLCVLAQKPHVVGQVLAG